MSATGGMAKGSNVPISHLDYNYVKDCRDVKELEEIIQVLRSGSEGYYPDLVEFTEKKLKDINPKSEVLRKDNPARSLKDLDADTRDAVTEDFQEWMNKMNDIDMKIGGNSGQDGIMNGDALPPVRSSSKITCKTEDEKVAESIKSKKRVAPRDYTEWEKFDVDKEMEDFDKKEVARENDSEKQKPFKLEPTLRNVELNAEERLLRAMKEKDKGNEAFRAQDFDEAIVYYTNSLQYSPTAASFNNRAAAELKVEKYSEAIEDCNKVLEMEPKNVKAFLRRGMAFKALKRFDLACSDFNSILQVEPKNKRAKDLLREIENTKRANKLASQDCEKERVNDSVNERSGNESIGDTETKKRGQRMKIIEVEATDDVAVESHRETTFGGVGEEVRTENALPQNAQTEERNLESSKEVLEDIKVVNGVKSVPEEMPIGSENNLKSEAEYLVAGDEEVMNSKSDFEGLPTNEEDHCLPAGPERTESKNEENSMSSQEIADASVSKKNGEADSVLEKGPGEDDTNKDNGYESKKDIAREIPKEVQELMKEGTKFYRMGHYSEALLKFSESVEYLWQERDSYRSAVSSLLNNKATCYFKMGDCKKCIVECEKSLELVNDNVKALVKRGMAYETMEKYVDAFKDFNRVRLLDGSHKLAQEHCSRVVKHLEMIHGRSWRKQIFETSRTDGSKSDSFPGVEKNAENTHDVRPLASAGNDSMSAFPSSNAQPDLRTGCNKDRFTAEVTEEPGMSVKERFLKMKEIGNSLVKQGKHTEAIAQYSECIQLCPEETAVYTNRALCYLQTKKYDLAETDCNTALTLQVDNIKALFRRGKARKELGRYREASEDFVKVLKVDSANNAAKKELTLVLDLLRKEKREDEKSATPKRKKILIQDIEGHDSKKPTTSETSCTKKETAEGNPKQNTKSKESPNKKSGKQNVAAPTKHTVKSAFQFLQAWKSVKNNHASEHLNILKQLNMDDLPKMLSNRLDADIMKAILNALHHDVKTGGNVRFVHQFLQKLTTVERFQMTLMFQSQQDKQALRKLFDDLSRQINEKSEIKMEELKSLQSKYLL